MIEGSCHCGAVCWRFDGAPPQTVTACSCTICRRYGALWAYDYEGERIGATGATQTYAWQDREIGFHFCPHCGCIVYWRASQPGADGRRRMAVNLRLAEPEAVAHIPIEHFDGLNWREPPIRDSRCIADMWF